MNIPLPNKDSTEYSASKAVHVFVYEYLCG